MSAGRPRKLDGREEEISDAYRSGASLAEIGLRVDANPGTVKKALVRAGVAIRPSRSGPKPGPAPERVPCACGCGSLAKPGRTWLHGHHRRMKRREEAAAIEVRAAGPDEVCQYRSPSMGTGSSGSSLLQEPICGVPVLAHGDTLCPRHLNAAYVESSAAERMARQLRGELTQACARCGREWGTTAMHARAAWDRHVPQCAARGGTA